MELRRRNSSVASGRLSSNPSGLRARLHRQAVGDRGDELRQAHEHLVLLSAGRRQPKPGEVLAVPPLVEREEPRAQFGIAERVRQDVEEAAERVRVHDHAPDADHGGVQAFLLGHALRVGGEAQALVVDERVGDGDDEAGLVAEVVADGRPLLTPAAAATFSRVTAS